MTAWYLFLLSLSVLQISSCMGLSRSTRTYSVATINDTEYWITESKDSYTSEYKRALIVIKPDGTNTRFLLPLCGRQKPRVVDGHKRIHGNLLFLHLVDTTTEEHFLQMVNLSDLFSHATTETCVHVASAFIRHNMVYIYRIEGGNTVKRWFVTSDGEETDPQVVATMKNPIATVRASFISVYICTEPHDKYSLLRCHDYSDLPQCDAPKGDGFCNGRSITKRKSEKISTIEETAAKSTTTAFEGHPKSIVINTD